MYGPIVEGSRLRLVPPSEQDIPTYLRWLADTRVTRFLLARLPLSPAHEAEWLESVSRNPDLVFWTVELDTEHGPRPIGNCNLGVNWRHRRAVFGLMIGETEEWGKGYGTELTQLVLAFAFRELGLHKVCSSVTSGNEGSRQVHLRAGFVPCGEFKDQFWFSGQWQDELRLEALRERWESEHGSLVKWPAV